MKTAIAAARKNVSSVVEESRAIRDKIRDLHFVVPTAECPDPVSAYRALLKIKTDTLTAPENRKARKALLRPETGAQRSELWNDKRGLRMTLRHRSLALLFIRDQGSKAKGRAGHAYRKAESKVAPGNEPNLSTIAFYVTEAGYEATEEQIGLWINETPAASSEIAVPSAEKAALWSLSGQARQLFRPREQGGLAPRRSEPEREVQARDGELRNEARLLVVHAGPGFQGWRRYADRHRESQLQLVPTPLH